MSLITAEQSNWLNDMIAALAIRYRMDGVNLVETICARVATQRGET